MKSYMPVKLMTGKGILAENKEVFRSLGKRCLIITSAHSARLSGALSDLENLLKQLDIVYAIYDSIKENPTVISCIEAGRMAHDYKADFVIGAGGGSVLDASKTASVAASNPSLTETDIYAQNWISKPLPLILVGTTAGTGSEVTSVSVMTNSSGMKKSIHNKDLYALYAFSDPEYTRSMPEKVRVSTAIDALAHLIESYFSKKASDLSRAYSFQGIRMLYPMLKKLQHKEELSTADLETIYDASILGGLAINLTGTVFCHTLGYYFTEHYQIPHGFACALFTNELLDYEAVKQEEYAKIFFDTLQIRKEDLKNVISALLPEYAFHLSLEEIDQILPRYENNNSVRNTYGTLNIEDIRNILLRLR